MSVKVEIKMDVQSMSDFMVYHIFSSTAGMMAVALGALNAGFVVSFIIRGNLALALLFFAFVIVIAVGFPYLIRRKVQKQMENSPKLSAPVTYEFDEGGVTTTTQDDSGKASWSKFKKIFSHKKLLIFYDESKRAIVLPVQQLGDDYTAVVDMICAHVPPKAVKIRRIDRKG